MAKEIKVSGKLIVKDVVAFMFYHNYSRWGGRLTALLGVLGLILAPIFLMNKDILSALIFAFLAFAYIVVTPLDFYAKARRQIHMNPVFKNKMTFIFEDDLLRVKLYTGASQVAWQEVTKVVMLKEIIFVYLQDNHALIIPKRNFLKKDDYEVVGRLIEEKKLSIHKDKRMEEKLNDQENL
ncbi:MAG: hypothetical protein CVU98_06140 [Firmicutes bacterium HGW-Firmicutes-3]|jgi:hypothetical protein|nr:MAG: hypothetical protein CVU98_06140 [Firmicutes bacterium HGW-Firmicutes-3]